jgi:hypothetical protein
MKKCLSLSVVLIFVLMLMGCASADADAPEVAVTTTPTSSPVTEKTTQPPITGTVTPQPMTVTTTQPATTTISQPITTPPNQTMTTAPSQVNGLTSKADLLRFLNANFSTCQTSIGITDFSFNVYENTSVTSPYDYWIQVKYDYQFFYELQYSIQITTAQNQQVCQELKDFQEQLARAVITEMPTKKFYGGYYDSWYKYPSLKLDLITRHYYSWANYSPQSILTSYEESKITGFDWYPLLDDQLTR